jgi:hypothetical protein
MSMEMLTRADIEGITGKKRVSAQAYWFRRILGMDVSLGTDGTIQLARDAYETVVRARAIAKAGARPRNRRQWTTDEVEYLKRRYPDTALPALVRELGRTNGTIRDKAKALCLERTNGMRFPSNVSPIGSERLAGHNYLHRKISMTGNQAVDWVAVHVMLWTAEHGAVPAGHCVGFADKDITNLAIENLILMSFGDRLRRNSMHRYPPELQSAMRANAKLRKKINEYDQRSAGPTIQDPERAAARNDTDGR